MVHGGPTNEELRADNRERIRELETQLTDIRKAMKAYSDSDLVSFATTLTARSERLDWLEKFVEDFVKPIADGVGHMRGAHGRSKVRDMRFGNMLDALDSCWDSIEQLLGNEDTKFPWEK